MSHRVALLIPDLRVEGGVKTVGLFLHDVLCRTDRYDPEIISLAMSAHDSASSRIMAPSTWGRGARVESRNAPRVQYRHVGARWTELEFQRYRPRPVLTDVLNPYDLIQVVAGIPPWAHVARSVDQPVALQVATLTRAEQGGRNGDRNPLRRLWRSGMTWIASQMETDVPSIVDAIFVENAWMYNHYRTTARGDVVHFAPPGVDTSLFHPAENGSNRGDYVLCVGRLNDSRKNVRLLFEAYQRLARRIADPPRLVLAGLSAPTEDDWAYADDLGIRDAVEMYEDVPDEELADLYRHATVFVLPSNEEGLGLVLAEAMASGTPVVSTDCGGPSTLIDDGTTGFLVPVGDAEALAERMAHLLMNPEKAATMGAAGRTRIENKFSVDAAGKRYLRVYDNLLGFESGADSPA